MTHVHIAIYKWKPGTEQADVEHALEMIRQVTQRVDGLRAIYCGPNTNKWAQGYTDGIVVIADSAEALQAYRSDAVHDEAAKIIEAMELDGIGVDFKDPT